MGSESEAAPCPVCLWELQSSSSGLKIPPYLKRVVVLVDGAARAPCGIHTRLGVGGLRGAEKWRGSGARAAILPSPLEGYLGRELGGKHLE